MKKILLSFILTGIGFSTALAQQQTVPGIKATFDGQTVYYKTGDTGESPVLSYKLDEQAKTKNALIHLKGITDPVLDVTLTQVKNLEIEHASYVEPKVKVDGVSDTVGFKETIFPNLKFTYGKSEILKPENYYVLYKAIGEGETETDVAGTPTEAGKYNMYVTFKYPYYSTYKQTFAIVDHRQVLNDLIEGEAAECFKTTVGQIPDEAHKALDDALADAIEKAKEVAGTDGQADAYYKAEIPVLKQAIENSYRQYWFDKLSQLIVTVDVYQKGLSDGDTKKKLAEALTEANDVCTGVIDLRKSSKTYKDAYDKLWNQYQIAIGAEVRSQITALYGSINLYKTKANDLAYDESRTLLDVAINNAQETYDYYFTKEGYVLSDIAALKKAIATLKEKAEKITLADYAKAKDALSDAIVHATSSKDVIEPVSTVIATDLGNAIKTAQGVLGAPASTAKELKAAAETLGTAETSANKGFEGFKVVKSELDSAITAAKSTLSNVSATHKGIYAALNNAIVDAYAIYVKAVEKTTTELSDALKAINDANATANEAEALADQIDEAVVNATNALEKIQDQDKKDALEIAINNAKTAVKEKSSPNDLEQALKDINDATKQYVDQDIAKARESLNAKINDAQAKIDNVLAYDEFKIQLASAKSTAKAVSDNVASTAKQLTEAAAALDSAIKEIVGKDSEKALSELNTVIDEAKGEYATINVINTTIADTLNAEIQKADSIVKSGVARDVVAEVEVLSKAIATAKDAVNSFKENSNELYETIVAAQKQSEKIDQEHTGIKQALTDAIGEANTALENNKTKTNEELEAEITKLTDAIEESKKAETAAGNLETTIQGAENALKTIVDTAKRAELQDAIDAAKSLFTDASKTSSDYEEAVETLSNTINTVVESDELLAKNALDDAIKAALSKIDEVVLTESQVNIVTAVNAAVKVSDNTEATAQELYAAKSVLSTAVEEIVAKDLAYAKKELSNAIYLANSAMKPYLDIADSIKSASDKSAYMDKVIKSFQNAIGEAETVKNSEISTSKDMISKIDDLSKAEKAMKDAYANQMTIETQKLADVYSREKYLAETVKKYNDVIGKKFEKARDHAAEVYGSIAADPETQYTLADVINARTGMDDEYNALQAEYASWHSNLNSLLSLIEVAEEEVQKIQDELSLTVKLDLNNAINDAKDVSANCRGKYSSDLKEACDTLQKAIDKAKYENTHWDFTDANPTFKGGRYEAGNAKYTRTGKAIAAGNYATFCMPMAIKVAYGDTAKFSSVYLPTNFAILNTDTKILKLFLTKVEEGEVIPAGTPFFAQLACKDTLDLISNSVVGKTLHDSIPTNIKVYDQVANSSFVTLDKDMIFVWSGTYNGTNAIENKFVFNTYGNFAKATGSINPFRAYLEQKKNEPTSDAKEVEAIEFEFGDGSETTGINNIMVGSSDGSQIYSIDGKKMDNNMNLNKGVYIINGKKVLK
ncbi:MAG: hypothetical protein Q4A15_02480 [Prevotellaceae bacterium]|nr:hypothetical protein [Prevotellaceae bacterium]